MYYTGVAGRIIYKNSNLDMQKTYLFSTHSTMSDVVVRLIHIGDVKMKTGNQNTKESILSHSRERTSALSDKKHCFCCLKSVCWLVCPAIIITLLILDGLGVYTFNTERLVALGMGLLVILLPFFEEITIKNFSIKRSEENPTLDP